MELNGSIQCFIGMIESLMYIGIGLLTGCLIGLAVVPLVHDRAVRLTIRRLERALPNSIRELEVDSCGRNPRRFIVVSAAWTHRMPSFTPRYW